MSVTSLKGLFSKLSAVEESNWQFVTSAGAELSIGTPIVHIGVNATGGALWLRDGAKGAMTRLTYGGAGVGASLSLIAFPANFSFSITDMPSSGKVYKLPWAGGKLSLSELKGTFVSFGAAADFGAGYGESVMFLGCKAIAATAVSVVPIAGNYLQLVALLSTANACVRFGGMSATVLPANLGVTAYMGTVA